MFALPTNLGGLGIDNPVLTGDRAFTNSCLLTKPLVDAILDPNELDLNMAKVEKLARDARGEIDKSNDDHNSESLKELLTRIECPKLVRCLEMAGEAGASGWLTTRPYPHLGFELNRLEFLDSLALRYGFEAKDLGSTCACGKPNNTDHTLSCAKGGYTILRHDNIRDLMAEICTYAGLKGVETEKLLQPCPVGMKFYPSENSAPDARMDVVAVGLWRQSQLAHMDVRVFHANAPSHVKTNIDQLYRRNESSKKLSYGRRVREIEGGAFSPLVMNTAGGIGVEFHKVLKKLSSRICGRTKEPYPEVMAHLRARLRFSLLRTCLIALRGNRRRIAITNLADTELVI